MAKKTKKIFKSAVSGKFVSKKYSSGNIGKKTTFSQRVMFRRGR